MKSELVVNLNINFTNPSLNTALENINVKLSEALTALTTGLDEIGAQLTKATTEIVGKITELEAQIADPTVDPGVITAKVAEIKTLAQGLDDLVPDAPVA